ncbi:treslin-like isoform X2 [Ptychodera flava]|uniref:treslin-like isoform X2 n=1 Tax=Ptychodera flava TaxID=63121 RepID=UPI00396A4AD4
MAAVVQSLEKHQVVLIIDLLSASSSGHDHINFQEYSSTVRLIALKLLYFFSNKRETTESLRWGYKFVYTREPKYERCARCSFKDFNLKNFKEFECDVISRIDEIVNFKIDSSLEAKKSSRLREIGSPVNRVKTSLTEVTQDFEWDLPDISSPTPKKPVTRPLSKQQDRRELHGNYVFILSPCPCSESSLQVFSGQSAGSVNAKGLKELLMSNSLYSQFHDVHKIRLYWIDTGGWCRQESARHPDDLVGYSVLSTVLEEYLNGRIIPVNAILNTGRCMTTNIQSVLGIHSVQATESEEGNVETEEENENSTLQTQRKAKKNCPWIDGVLPISSVAGYFASKPNGPFHDVPFCNEAQVLLSRKKDTGTDIYCKLELLPLSKGKSTNTIVQSADALPKASESSGQSGVMGVDKALTMTDQGQVTSVKILKETSLNDAPVQHMYICGVVPSHCLAIDMCDLQQVYGCVGFNHQAGSSSVSQESMPCPTINSESGEKDDTSISSWFQSLQCVLAQQQLALVVEFCNVITGLPVTAVLQPLTFTMATLRIVQPEKILSLEKELVFGFRLRNEDHSSTLSSTGLSVVTSQIIEPWYSSHPCYGACQKLVQELINIPVSDEETDKRPVSSLMQDIQEMYWREKQDQKNKTQQKQEVKVVQDDKIEENKKAKVKKPFRRTKSMNLLRGELMVDKSKEVVNKQSQKSPEKKEEEEKKKAESQARRQDIEKDIINGHIKFTCQDDLLLCVQEKYENCLNKTQISFSKAIQDIVYTILHHFKAELEDKEQSKARCIVDKLILSDKELRQKYANDDSDAGKLKKKQEIMLQVLLRIEQEIYMPSKDDLSDVLDQIHVLLGMLTLMYPGEKRDAAFLKEELLENYLYVCPKFLCAIYEEMMQPLPDELKVYSENKDDEDDDDDNDDDSKGLASCQSAGSVTSLDSQGVVKPRTRSMTRHFSLTDAAVKKQIVVQMKPAQKRKVKQKSRAISNGKKKNQKDSKKEEVKKVRRNLFTGEEESIACSEAGSDAVCVMAKPKTPTTPRKGNQLVLKTKQVSETPKWKQVSNAMLNRLDRARKRSKTVTEVAFVKESPLKSMKTDSSKPSKERLMSPRTYIKTLRRRNSFYSARDRSPSSRHQHALDLKKSREFADRLAGRTVVSPEDSKETVKSPTLQSDTKTPASFLLCEIFSPNSLKRVRKVSMKEGEEDSPSKNTRSQISMTPTKLTARYANESVVDIKNRKISDGLDQHKVKPELGSGKISMSPRCVLRDIGEVCAGWNTKTTETDLPTDGKKIKEETVSDSEKHSWSTSTSVPSAGINKCENASKNRSGQTQKSADDSQTSAPKSKKVATSLMHLFQDSGKEETSRGEEDDIAIKVMTRSKKPLCKSPTPSTKRSLASADCSNLKQHFSTVSSPPMTTRSSSRSPEKGGIKKNETAVYVMRRPKQSLCKSPTPPKAQNLRSPDSSSLKRHFTTVSPTMTTRSSSRSPSEVKICPTCSPTYMSRILKSPGGEMKSPSSCCQSSPPHIMNKLKMKTPESLDKWPRRKRNSTKTSISPIMDKLTSTPAQKIQGEEKLSPMGSPIFGKRKHNSGGKNRNTTMGTDTKLPPSGQLSHDFKETYSETNLTDCFVDMTKTPSKLLKVENTKKISPTNAKYLTRSKSRELDKSPTFAGQENLGTPRAGKRLREVSPEYVQPITHQETTDIKNVLRLEEYKPSPKRSKGLRCQSNSSDTLRTVQSPDPVNTHFKFASPVNDNTHIRFTRWSSPAMSSLESSTTQNNSDYFSSDNDEVFLGSCTSSAKTGSGNFSPVQLSAHGLNTLLNSPITTAVPSRQRCSSDNVIKDKQKPQVLRRKCGSNDDFVIKKRK